MVVGPTPIPAPVIASGAGAPHETERRSSIARLSHSEDASSSKGDAAGEIGTSARDRKISEDASNKKVTGRVRSLRVKNIDNSDLTRPRQKH